MSRREQDMPQNNQDERIADRTIQLLLDLSLAKIRLTPVNPILVGERARGIVGNQEPVIGMWPEYQAKDTSYGKIVKAL